LKLVFSVSSLVYLEKYGLKKGTLVGVSFTPGRDIGSAVFMMWVLVQSGMLSCDSTVNTD
jgi:hypothetical protein